MNFKFDDSVLYRLVQILQESMILGIDIVDLLRKLEVTQSANDVDKLVLTPEYLACVEKWHDELLENADKLQAQVSETKPSDSGLIFS